MVVRSDPAPLSWLIGVELASYRNAAKLSMAEVASRTGMSKAKVGHLESGRTQQAPEDIATVMAVYGAGHHDVDRLTALTARADHASWWAPWAHVVPDWLKTFVGLEGLAEREFVFEPVAIPGLLQTADYAAAVTAETLRVRPDHGERFVGFRMARTRRLTDEDRPLRLHAVITEGALRLAIGDQTLRQAQLRHLLAMAELPTVTIQVVRPEDGLHAAANGQFVVLDFETVRSIGYVELQDGAVYVQDPEQVRAYTMAAENLQRVAPGPEQSAALIQSKIEP
jgi:transcriptional regulator with XRE-family HTH domain